MDSIKVILYLIKHSFLFQMISNCSIKNVTPKNNKALSQSANIPLYKIYRYKEFMAEISYREQNYTLNNLN